jgi:hypothetical protein
MFQSLLHTVALATCEVFGDLLNIIFRINTPYNLVGHIEIYSPSNLHSPKIGEHGNILFAWV